MSKRAPVLGLLAMLVCVGGTAAMPAAKSPTAASFSKDVLPIFQRRCVACHVTGSEPGGMSLAPGLAYAQLVGKASTESALPRVKAGKPDASYLLHKLQGTQASVGGKGARMPFGGPYLDDASIAKIRAWIAAGAPKN
ncbi:hypothetical protein [Sphingobium sp.]|uniref:hypothetical protein n=1 Tax=Sphingobium sp. TaxID=1912891 RepID=UPI0028BE503E|nr:hypothetical protein [Sphingobium sp.]